MTARRARVRVLFVSLAAVLFAVSGARAAHWSPVYQVMGLDGPASADGQALALDEWSNELVVAGYFTTAGGLPAPNVALWDGDTWRVVGNGMEHAPGYAVRAAHGYGSALWLGGEFTGGVACWDGALQRWLDLKPVGGTAYDFAEYGGHLYAGGFFETGDPYAPYAPIAWHGASSWHYDLTNVGFNGPAVYSLQTWLGELYLGGGFQLPLHGAVSLCRWDGTDVHGYDVDGNVLDLEATDASLLAAGWFDGCAGVTSPGVAIVTSDSFSPFATPGTDFRARAIASQAGQPIAVAADDRQVYLRNGLGGWSDALGGVLDGQPFALRWYGNDLYAGGTFTNGVARWDEGVHEWINLGGGLQAGNTVYAIAEYGGEVYAGGLLTISDPSVDQVDAYLLRWRHGWCGVAGAPNNRVWALKTYGADLLAGGDFTDVGGVPCSRLARWDGTAWHAFGEPNAGVHALADASGDLIVAGAFTTIGGVAASRVARWDGAQWHGYTGTINSLVNAATTFRGDLIVGGAFTQAGGRAAAGLARWTGTAWEPLGAGCDGVVNALAVWQDELYAGGVFTTAGGQPAAGVARWDGTQWHDVGGSLGGLDDLEGGRALLATRDALVVGGSFTSAGSQPASCLATWDGAQWAELAEGVHDGVGATTVAALAVVDGDLYLGGRFQRTGDTPASNFGRWVDSGLVATTVQCFRADVIAAGAGLAPVVSLTWRLSEPISASRLGLEATSEGAAWAVPFVADADGPPEQAYAARDTSARLLGATAVTYGLRCDGRLLAEQSVRFAAPLPAAARPVLTAQPNPFNPRTTVSFMLARPGPARLAIYDLTGHAVATLIDAHLPAGPHACAWDGHDERGRALPSGTYLARLVVKDGMACAKLVLVR
jgi:trimeric autotransporter adhesin